MDGTPDEEILRLTVHGPWADMSNEAYRKMLLRQGAPAYRSNAASTFEPKKNNVNSDSQSIDWRHPKSGKTAVSRVKDQGQCGSYFFFFLFFFFLFASDIFCLSLSPSLPLSFFSITHHPSSPSFWC